MRKLGGVAVIVVGLIVLAATSAPATDRASAPADSVQVSDIGGSLSVIGGPSADRLVVDRDPGQGPLIITANRPIRTEGDCVRIAKKVVECEVSDLGFNLVELAEGADRIELAARDYTDFLIWGNAGDDRLIGGRLDDYLAGLGGDDVVIGRAGNDRLAGQDGHDELTGGKGADLLIGGPDRDHCMGGPGRDERRKC